ncbi:Putative transporter protein [Candida maltosa Xu316]|uniref:Putative transporter protein n=1 Tax=Candida maltosa (strain Xu316) TaxID=1245528 RepID=M3J028_CANMX|nr:Putative transporter protein [Candida maltosa Xu316]
MSKIIYHTIDGGVTIGLPTRSLNTKYGWKLSLSILAVTPSGFDDPLTCKAIKCIHTNAASINGSKK